MGKVPLRTERVPHSLRSLFAANDDRCQQLNRAAEERVMVSKCANPACAATFMRFGTGKLFCLELPMKEGARRMECYWLCPTCAATMRVEIGPGAGPIVISERIARKPSRAAA